MKKTIALGVVFLIISISIIPIGSSYSIENLETSEKSPKVFVWASIKAILGDVNKYWNESIGDWTYDGIIRGGIMYVIIFIPIPIPIGGPVFPGDRIEVSEKDSVPNATCIVRITPLFGGKVIFYNYIAYGFQERSNIEKKILPLEFSNVV